MAQETPVALRSCRYGKDQIRVFRLVRDGDWHNVVEYNVTALLEGNIDTRRVLLGPSKRVCADHR
jgi:hypothetical protein